MGKRQRTFFDASPAPAAKRPKPRAGLRCCMWPGCAEVVPARLWGCKPHWYRLPKSIRDRILETYRPGQEVDMKLSREYLEAARAASDWVLALQRGG